MYALTRGCILEVSMEDPSIDKDVMERLARDVLTRLETGAEGPLVRYVGDYRIDEEIARGGMGVVYRATQTSLGRTVALKMILSGRFASTEEVARFQVEARAAARLSHPGIVAIYEVGVHEGHDYFTMEYVEGHDLERAGNGSPIAARRAAEIARDVAQAVQHAHDRGILHRDLKPSNILIDREGRTRITDFGIAKRTAEPESLTGTGQLLGTPGYIAPEHLEGASPQVASDVYSIGAILYELITGRPPHVAETALAVLLQARDTDPLPPASLNPRVPTSLATVCMNALERSPAKRYASAAALAADLERFLAGEPVLARPPKIVRRAALWIERHPWLVSAALALAIVIACAVAYGFYAETKRLHWLLLNPGASVLDFPLGRTRDSAGAIGHGPG